MAENKKDITFGKIGNALKSVAADHVTAFAEDVFDETRQEYQSEINQTLQNEIEEEANRAKAAEEANTQAIAKRGIYDVSAYNDGAVFESLSALLNNANLSTLIPTSVRCGGMSIRFIQSVSNSDNKYVQFRCTAEEFTTDTTQWIIADEGVYVENPEFVYVKTDKDNKILLAIKTDGTIYFGAGVPLQVVEYINNKIIELELNSVNDIVGFLNGIEEGDKTLQQILNEKLDAEGLDTNALDTIRVIETPDWLDVKTDSEDNILEGIKTDGTKVIELPLEIQRVRLETVDNLEFIQVETDNEGRILEGRKTDGTKVEYCNTKYPNGIPDDIKYYVRNKINSNNVDNDNVISRNISKEGVVVQSFYYGRNNPRAKNLAFCWGSDFHGTEKSLRNMFFYAEHFNNVLFSLNTGDTQRSSPLSTDILTPASQGMKKPILNVIGNHDNGYGTDIKQMASAELKYQRYIQPFLENAGITQPSDLSDYPCYYYKDFSDFGIRLIIVDMYNAPKVTYDGGTKIANQDAPCISEKQAVFIGNALQTLPNNYGVIIAAHVSDNLSTSIVSSIFTDPIIVNNNNIDCGVAMDYPVISDLVGKFIAKERLQKTYSYTGSVYDALTDNGLPTSFSLDINFSERENSEFICYLFGHQHRDIVAKYDTDLLGLYVINGGTGDRDQSFSDIARKDEGITQDCFNVVSINRSDRKVSLVRVGADTTINFTKRNYISFNY